MTCVWNGLSAKWVWNGFSAKLMKDYRHVSLTSRAEELQWLRRLAANFLCTVLNIQFFTKKIFEFTDTSPILQHICYGCPSCLANVSTIFKASAFGTHLESQNTDWTHHQQENIKKNISGHQWDRLFIRCCSLIKHKFITVEFHFWNEHY